MDFREFPKLARWSRDVVVTEKLDGTNASVHIRPAPLDHSNDFESGMDCQIEVDGEPAYIRAGSRTRWVMAADDNYGFAAWVHEHAHELAPLGLGHHFGEWWGRGIQRNYSLPERRFSLFNATRWTNADRPACCSVVPILYQGPNVPGLAEREIRKLKEHGSFAAPGFMDPEGIVLFHTAAGIGFKKTITKDESPKGKVTP